MVQLKDYKRPPFSIVKTFLTFELGETETIVHSTLQMKRVDSDSFLKLDGEDLELLEVKIDGVALSIMKNGPENSAPQPSGQRAALDGGQLWIPVAETVKEFKVEIKVKIHPEKNQACEGLYRSKGMFCTQCEAESFRRITYYLDRPDVMSEFEVTILADPKKYPVLLSNGNLLEEKTLTDGRKQVRWHDPFRKPAYLFALVAGDLGCLRDSFITQSGRKIALEIFCQKGLEPRCEYAMGALKRSMKWDEDRFGLEYDLDRFMIVVADDFNMGAMENKGLNIFNSKYILADESTATDKDFSLIESIVGHEYFHNWTGNRITCRDWFQLSLKEGLTVYRDQEFSADMGSAAVKRIDDVVRLRSVQFPEDAGPMAHPVRPQSYISIDNFYTATVYEKGSELIRMLATLLGRDGFRRGMDKYFELFDGQAVTTEDFVHAMEVANKRDFTQFKNWYDQAGTPTLTLKSEWEQKTGDLKLTVSQSCLPTSGQPEKKPYVIPFAYGILDTQGVEQQKTQVIEVTKPTETFTIKGIQRAPVLSPLRGFSAPVNVEFQQSGDDLATLLAHDTDAFTRWDSGQKLMLQVLLAEIKETDSKLLKQTLLRSISEVLQMALKRLGGSLQPAQLAQAPDAAFTSYLLQLPSEAYIAQFLDAVDPERIWTIRDGLMREIANTHTVLFAELESALSKLSINPDASGERMLRNSCLLYLCLTENQKYLDLAVEVRRSTKNMTVELGCLEALNRTQSPQRVRALNEFIEKWKHEPLVVNKWLTIRAIAPHREALDEVKTLLKDPIFDKTNPNKIYALLVSFGYFNPRAFHQLSGNGYRLLADEILDIDQRNPQVAARVVSAFNQWKKYEPRRQSLMKTELERIKNTPRLSNNVGEIVGRALQN